MRGRLTLFPGRFSGARRHSLSREYYPDSRRLPKGGRRDRVIAGIATVKRRLGILDHVGARVERLFHHRVDFIATRHIMADGHRSGGYGPFLQAAIMN